MFSDFNKKVIDFLEEKDSSVILNYKSTNNNYFAECEKITDQDFITKYKKYVEIN